MQGTPLKLRALVAITVSAAVLWTAWGLDPRISFTGSALWFWLALCFGAECLWIRTPGGLATISMASCAHFAGLLVLSRSEVMLVAMVASVLAERWVLRKAWVRVVYNAAQAAIAVGAARLCFDLLGGRIGPPVGPMLPTHYLALAAAGVLYFVMNHGATSLAVSLDQGRPLRVVWGENFGLRYEMFSSATLLCLGVLLAMQYLAAGALGVLPLILPVVLAKDGYDRFLASLNRGRRARSPSAGKEPGGDEADAA
jgi:hypothetical protein